MRRVLAARAVKIKEVTMLDFIVEAGISSERGQRMIRMRNVAFGACVLTLIACQSAFSDVYMWKDPSTGSSKISNLAPAWYRSGGNSNGPRVIVLRGNRVIDDTRLRTEERQQLRRTVERQRVTEPQLQPSQSNVQVQVPQGLEGYRDYLTKQASQYQEDYQRHSDNVRAIDEKIKAIKERGAQINRDIQRTYRERVNACNPSVQRCD